MGTYNMTDLIKQQQEFVEWLKAKGLYNAFDPSHIMQRMFEVWKAMKSNG